MTTEERKKLIAKYSAGYDEVAASIEGLSDETLTAHPLAGKWSVAEVVHHLADSEMTSAIRLRRLLAEEHPVIYGYDQDVYSTRLNYNEREIAPALEALRASRATTAQLLARMSNEDWARQGWHTESGSYSTERWLEIYAAHAHNHAAQIRQLRKALKV